MPLKAKAAEVGDALSLLFPHLPARCGDSSEDSEKTIELQMEGAWVPSTWNKTCPPSL